MRGLAFLTLVLALAGGCTQPPEAAPDDSAASTTTSPPPISSPFVSANPTETLVPRIQPDPQRRDPELPTAAERASLPPCEDPLFGTSPVDLDRVTSITPIGTLAPPGHTFPTEHPFLHLWPGNSRDEILPLLAPGNLTVLLISSNRGITQDPADYTIWFAPCRDLVAYLNHVKDLSAELRALYDAGSCRFPGESKAGRCNVFAFHAVAGGTPIGGVGGQQGNFDFGAIDLRTRHTFANPSRYSTRSLHIQCAFDYYDEESRGRFYALLERPGADGCGTSAVDKPGTLQGNWFHSTTRDSITEWTKHLSFAPHNVDATLLVVSVAGQAHEAGTLGFVPEAQGTTNRYFADVTPDGRPYCYQGTGMTGRFLLELTHTTGLRIEHRSGTCADAGGFGAPHAYFR